MKSWLSAPKNGAQECHGLDQGVKSGRLRIKEIRQFVMAITALRYASSMIPQCRGRGSPGRTNGSMIMLILSIAVFIATLATPVVVLALWQHFEARELRRQVRAIQW